jgi:hypothetical protein
MSPGLVDCDTSRVTPQWRARRLPDKSLYPSRLIVIDLVREVLWSESDAHPDHYACGDREPADAVSRGELNSVNLDVRLQHVRCQL